MNSTPLNALQSSSSTPFNTVLEGRVVGAKETAASFNSFADSDTNWRQN